MYNTATPNNGACIHDNDIYQTMILIAQFQTPLAILYVHQFKFEILGEMHSIPSFGPNSYRLILCL